MSNVNVCQIVFERLDSECMFNDDSTEFEQLLDQVRNLIGHEMSEAICTAANMRVARSEHNAFTLGWQLRGEC